MKSYNELQKEFDSAVARLQEECPHMNISDWHDIHWAIGHSTGNRGRRCENCNMQTHWEGTETFCLKCHTRENFNTLNPCCECKADEEFIINERVLNNYITGEKKILDRYKQIQVKKETKKGIAFSYKTKKYPLEDGNPR